MFEICLKKGGIKKRGGRRSVLSDVLGREV